MITDVACPLLFHYERPSAPRTLRQTASRSAGSAVARPRHVRGSMVFETQALRRRQDRGRRCYWLAKELGLEIEGVEIDPQRPAS